MIATIFAGQPAVVCLKCAGIARHAHHGIMSHRQFIAPIVRECMMATLDTHALYDELLDLLADSADVQRVLAFRLSSLQQDRGDISSLEKNREAH